MKRFDMLKCKECGAVVDVIVGCGKCDTLPEGFELLEEKIADATTEKHVPYIEEHPTGYVVKVGKEIAHPMLPEHFIQFIEIIIDGDRVYRKYLKPGDEPLACFEIPKGNTVIAREYCNIHGLWKSNK